MDTHLSRRQHDNTVRINLLKAIYQFFPGSLNCAGARGENPSLRAQNGLRPLSGLPNEQLSY
jgi:hypothetical protein